MSLRSFALSFVLLLGCRTEQFQCVGSDQCGTDGVCEENGYCSFPATDCESGRRYGQSAVAGVAGVCVPLPEGSTGLASTSSSTSPSTSTTSASFTNTTDAVEVSSSSSGGPQDSSTGPSDSTADISTSTGVDSSSSSSTTNGSSTSSTQVQCEDLSKQDGSCGSCFECTEMPSEDCSALAMECDVVPGCREIESCLTNCAVSGLCFDDCCMGMPQGSIGLALELHECHRNSCLSGFCPEFVDAQCSE